jgi:hypothetical protein
MEAAQIQDRVPADVRDFLKMLAETDFEHELLMRVWRLGYDDALLDALKAKLKEVE